jgi:hypothetical protein
MDDKLIAFAAAWGSVWAEGTSGARAGGEPRGVVALDDTPAYPLARTVEMPEGHGYETGALSFRLSELEIHGVGRLGGAQGAVGEGGIARIRLRLARLTLRGRYAVEAKPDPIVDLDTGGDLMDLPPDALLPTGTSAAEDGTIDPDRARWLNQARGERLTLRQTPNGRRLLSVYDQHNEIYNKVFQENGALRALWRAGGATKEMAADTSAALKDGTVINSATKRYPGGRTYNGNAFAQRLNVATSCVWTDPEFDPVTGPPPGSRYWEAARAALAFGEGVQSETKSAGEGVREMRGEQVYAAVERHEGGLPEVSDQEIMELISQISSQGREAAQLISQISSQGREAAPSAPGRFSLDEEDRNRLRRLYIATMKRRAEGARVRGEPLFAGPCEARLDGAEATIEIAVDEGPEGGRARALSARIDLPPFELAVDDSTWSGAPGRVARERLEQMGFARSLLRAAVVARLEEAVRHAAERAYAMALKDT